MLNGIDPVLVFQFKNILDDSAFAEFVGDLPLVSKIPTLADESPIPIYLSQDLTGLVIDSEDKNVDIETSVETTTKGSDTQLSQKGINSSVTVNLLANKNAIGIKLLSSLIDKLYNRVTSKEYSLSYLNGATTIFRGKLQSYQVNQVAESTKLSIQLIISIGEKAPKTVNGVPNIQKIDGLEGIT